MQQCETVDAHFESLSLLVVAEAAANTWVLPYDDRVPVVNFQPARTCGGTDGYLTRSAPRRAISAPLAKGRLQQEHGSLRTSWRATRCAQSHGPPREAAHGDRKYPTSSGSPRRSLERPSWAHAFGAWRGPGCAVALCLFIGSVGASLPRLSADWPSLREGTSFWLVGAGWSTSNHRGLCRLHPLLSPPAANSQINDVAAACKSFAVILHRNALLMQE